ncbi:5-carboxymethyl-2-hydroxymuconate Delta-isomerase [Streptomyces sp. SID10815]|uniref:5-carboxymethyl-2-hydroxymuconate Delta-isomerase n=1 Tax=Streptomyces sp. SID10815 TaxID=2706027 RepID=UPI0013CCACF2|nr:5-carboxymethyl-2-hydroxymuconate Delta-isomerase [Streptomyces sp. SID10815]NEA46473.1 5-carboxymethyl-2-hydroxymuconate Delta-isomerase [Streptomyces sp. SID10815]
MPHLVIDCSAPLADALDRAALIEELHPLVLADSGSTGVCKTVFRRAETYVGDGADADGRSGGNGFVHVEVGLMPGRSEALKARLSERILTLLVAHLPAAGAGGATCSVEVRDLAGSYRLFPTARSPRRTGAPVGVRP